MRPTILSVLVLAVACATATTTPPQPTPTIAPAESTPVAAPPAATPVAAAPRAGGMPPNPNQEANDQVAKAVLDRIAGRENEPAEQVFKNIQSLKGVPAGRFVRIMNMGYSRALGVGCLHCHYGPDYSSDEKRQKRAAREMMAMNKMINDRLQSLQNLEGKPEERVVNCSTCHRGHVDPTAGM
jgi:hypothetical protein